VNTWRIVIFEVKSALLTPGDEECGFSHENGEQYRKDPFEGVAGSIVVFNVVLPGAKSDRQLLHSPETERIPAITLRKFGSDLLIRFPSKNEISDDRSLLQQERHCENDKRPEM
jgi:hypothetical protein